jgi:antitoxin component YwqK of YwqJK toxin-antitoxin module
MIRRTALTARVATGVLVIFLAGCSNDDDYASREEKWPDGTLKSRVHYKINADGKEELWGVGETWFEDGQLETRIEYARGRKHGLSEAYYANGQMKEKGTYAFGLRDGTWESWNDAGESLGVAKFSNGKPVK